MWLCAAYLTVLVYGDPMVFHVKPHYKCLAGGGLVQEGRNLGPLVFKQCQYITVDRQPVPVTAAMIKEFEETGDQTALCTIDLYREESLEVGLLRVIDFYLGN